MFQCFLIFHSSHQGQNINVSFGPLQNTVYKTALEKLSILVPTKNGRGRAQSRPKHRGCAREHCSHFSQESHNLLPTINQSAAFTDITSWACFTDNVNTDHGLMRCRDWAAPSSACSCLLGPTGPYWALALPARCRPLLGVTGTNHSYNPHPLTLLHLKSSKGQLDQRTNRIILYSL